MKVKYVEWGLANRFKESIELNKNLKNYPQLHDPLLKHEIQHSDKFVSWHDLKLDLTQNPKLDNFELMKFMFKHPKTLIQFLPIYWQPKKGFVYDLNLSIVYLIMFIIVGLSVYVGWII